MRFIENALAVIGLLAIIGLALFGVLNIVDRAQAKPTVARLEPRMLAPVQYDASICQRGAAPDKWKCKVYLRRDK